MLEATEATFTIAPRPRAIMPGRTARMARYIDVTLMSKLRAQSSSSQARIDPECTQPTPLNRMSIGSAAASASCRAVRSVTSSVRVRIVESRAGRSASFSPDRLAATTSAPPRA